MTASQPPISLETSHGRPRVTVRRLTDGGLPPLPATDVVAADRDPATGRFVKANGAARRRRAKALKGVATLNPDKVAPYLREHVVDGIQYAVELVAKLPDHPAYHRAAGDLADARTVFRALLAQGAAGDAKSLSEAKGWLREYRAFLATLAAIGRELPDASAADRFAHLYQPEEPK